MSQTKTEENEAETYDLQARIRACRKSLLDAVERANAAQERVDKSAFALWKKHTIKRATKLAKLWLEWEYGVTYSEAF